MKVDVTGLAASMARGIVIPQPPSDMARLESRIFQEICEKRMGRYGVLRGNEADLASKRASEIRVFYRRKKEEEDRRQKDWEYGQIQMAGHFSRRDEARAAFDAIPLRPKKHHTVDPIVNWCRNRTFEAVKSALDCVRKPYMSKEDKKLVREAAKYDRDLAYIAAKRGL